MRLLAIVTILNVMTSLGFATAGLVRPEAILPVGLSATPAVTIFALYAFSRSLVLAGCAVGAAIRRRGSELWLLGAIGALVQIADAAVGAYSADIGKTIGPLVVAGLQVCALAAARRNPTWAAQ
jgi:hypothetical protein